MNFSTEHREGDPSESSRFEFYYPTIDTLLLVQNSEEHVVVRATEGTFSDRKKECFIRELAMEGFIPVKYRWFCIGGEGVRWVLDRSWLKVDEAAAERTRRLMLRVAVVGALFWILLMVSVGSKSVAGTPAHRPASAVVGTENAR